MKVIINGKFAPIVGRICMDQCMIDVTDLGDVKVGDEVVLLGEDRKLIYYYMFHIYIKIMNIALYIVRQHKNTPKFNFE